MRRLTLTALLFATAFISGPASAQMFQDQSVLFGRRHGYVYEGRWCAREETGAGRVEENCHYDSFEACRRQVTQGNRGFCTENPAYAAGLGGEPPRRKRRAN